MEGKEKLKGGRNSSLELLRIVCMFFIVLHHFMLNSAFPGYEEDILNASNPAVDIARFVNGYCCVAVNCFILITGYFGLKFKIKRLLSLYFVCAFYGLIGYLLHLYLGGYHFGRSVLDYTVFALSNSKWWFINCYIVLLFTAPLLNKAIENLNRDQYGIVLILLTIVNVYFGFVGGRTGYNQAGYCVAQFVYLYVIGGYLRRFVSLAEIRKNRGWFVTSFLILSGLIGLTACAGARLDGSPIQAYYYNNPLVIASSFALFCFMLSFDFHSRFINHFAASAVAIYIFQEQPFIGYGWLYPSVQEFLIRWGADFSFPTEAVAILSEFSLLLLISIGFVIAVLIFDQVRVFLMKPVWMLVDKVGVHTVKMFPEFLE